MTADTDYPSRVRGAKQAIDQIFAAIPHKSITNLKSSLPEGYTNAGPSMVPGVGKATGHDQTEPKRAPSLHAFVAST